MPQLRKPAFSFAILLLCALVATDAFEWADCPDEKSDLQRVTEVSLMPEPVPAGAAAKFEIKGISRVSTASSVLKLAVYYLGLPVFRDKIPSPVKISKGNFTISFARDFPTYTPPGSYKVKIENISKEGDLLVCLDVKFKVTWATWGRDSIVSLQ